MYHPTGDNVGREPHWAARRYGAGVVRIIYLLSYYRDAGSNAFLCQFEFLPGDSRCGGHPGDSESIVLDVTYFASSKHWVLTQAYYSNHENQGWYSPSGASLYPTELYYPGEIRVGTPGPTWRSASMPTMTPLACNAGGTLGTDTCDGVAATARVATGSILEHRRRNAHAASQDCMPSSNPSYIYYGMGRLECYWSGTDFRGWTPLSIGGAGASGYSSILALFGFSGGLQNEDDLQMSRAGTDPLPRRTRPGWPVARHPLRRPRSLPLSRRRSERWQLGFTINHPGAVDRFDPAPADPLAHRGNHWERRSVRHGLRLGVGSCERDCSTVGILGGSLLIGATVGGTVGGLVGSLFPKHPTPEPAASQ